MSNSIDTHIQHDAADCVGLVKQNMLSIIKKKKKFICSLFLLSDFWSSILVSSRDKKNKKFNHNFA